MDTQAFIYHLQGYIKEIINDLEAVKKISDLEEKWSKVNFDTAKHSQNFEFMKASKPEEVSYYSYSNYSDGDNNSLERYDKEIKKLSQLQTELLQKYSKIREQKEQSNREYNLKTSHCSYCKNKPPANHYIYSTKNKILKPRKRNASLFDEWLFCSEAHFEKWHKKNYFCCAECNKEEYEKKYWYRKNKNDNKKFCSQQCCNLHYAEICDKCQQKALGNTYYSDAENKTGTLCSSCNKVELAATEKAIKKIHKELNEPWQVSESSQEELDEERPTVHCRYCSAKCPGIFNVCEKEECLNRNDQEVEGNNPQERERERERERQISLNKHNYSQKSWI